MNAPHSLKSTSINPANLIELEVLSQIVSEKQNNNDIRGSIPYLAKMAQIIDNQRLEQVTDNNEQQQRIQQRTLYSLQADAHRQLGQAYLGTGLYTQAEASLSITIQRLESLLKDNNGSTDTVLQLLQGYDLLKECFQVMNKPHLVQGMENRKLKYTIPSPPGDQQ
ncbi:unnamed protein product [Absidia cylindrospora]